MNELQQFREQTVNEVTTIINSIIVGVDLGNVNPLEAFAVFKTMEKIFEKAKKTVDELAIIEAEKYGKSTFTLNGQNYEVRQGAKRVDYSAIEEWQIAKENLKEIEEKYKGVLKLTELKQSVLDESTGEILKCPTVTFNKSSLIVK